MVKALYSVLDPVSRCQYKHGDAWLAQPHAPQYPQTVKPGQVQIQHKQVIVKLPCHRTPLLAVVRDVHRVVLGLQALTMKFARAASSSTIRIRMSFVLRPMTIFILGRNYNERKITNPHEWTWRD